MVLRFPIPSGREEECPADVLLLLSKRTAERMLARCKLGGKYLPPLHSQGIQEALGPNSQEMSCPPSDFRFVDFPNDYR